MSTSTNSRHFGSAGSSRIPTGYAAAVVVFLLGTWLGSGALLVLQPLVGVSPDLLMLTQFGPSLGVLGVVLFQRIRPTSTAVAASPRPTAFVLRRIVVGAGLAMVVFAASVGVLALIGQPVQLQDPGRLGASLWLLVPLQLVGACGEELGWRAFLQQHLQTRWPMTAAAVVVGTLWATWHVEYYRLGVAFFAAFWLSCVAMSVIMALVGGRSDARADSAVLAGPGGPPPAVKQCSVGRPGSSTLRTSSRERTSTAVNETTALPTDRAQIFDDDDIRALLDAPAALTWAREALLRPANNVLTAPPPHRSVASIADAGGMHALGDLLVDLDAGRDPVPTSGRRVYCSVGLAGTEVHLLGRLERRSAAGAVPPDRS